METPPPETIWIDSDDDHPVGADIYRAPVAGPHPWVVLVHGFKGYRTWGFLPYVAASLVAGGMTAVVLDLSLNGTHPAPAGPGGDDGAPGRRYVRPDLFERNTIAREIRDVGVAIDHVRSAPLAARGACSTLGLFGHSRGGVAAFVNAVERGDIGALCTWSTVSDADTYTDRQKTRWREAGAYEFVTSDGAQLRIGIDHLDDIEANGERYRLRERVSALRVPFLVVHGTADVVVPPDHARRIHDAASPAPDRRCILVKTGHTFGLENNELPADVPPPLVEATRESVTWFRKHLSTGGPER